MKKVMLAAAAVVLALAALAAAGCGGNKVPAGAIAAVGDGVVTKQQFDQIGEQAKAQYRAQLGPGSFPKEGTAQYRQLKASIVDYLVQNELIRQKAAEMDVVVKDDELKQRMDMITAQVGGKKKLEKLLREQHLTMAQAEEQVKAQMLLEKVRAKVAESIKVSDDEIRAFYNDPDNRSMFVVPEQVEARHILVKTKAEAEKVRALLVADPSDANWKKVAKEYSVDPGSKDNGGSLGTFPRGRMVPAFEKVAFSLKVGEISQPVKTQFGWHVIQVLKKIPGSKKTLEQARGLIEQQLKYQKEAKAWQDWLKKAEEEMDIVYAPGYDPDELRKTPSPAASPGQAATPSPSASK